MNSVRSLGLTINDVNLLGRVTAPAQFSNGWASFEIETSFYDVNTHKATQICIPVITRNTRDISLVERFVDQNKQIFVKGNYYTWLNADNTKSGAVVFSLIKFGVSNLGINSFDCNFGFFIGKVSSDITLSSDGLYMLFTVDTEFVEKTEDGFKDAVVTIPFALSNTDPNKNIIKKMYSIGRQISLQCTYAFYTDASGNQTPGFLCKLFKFGMKPRKME